MGRPAMLGPGNASGKATFKREKKILDKKVGVVTEKAMTVLMKKVADKEISKTLELKFTSSGTQATLPTFNSIISSYAECYPCVPQVVPGLTSWTRQGNQITPSKLELVINVGLTSVNRSIAIRAHVFVMSLKKINRFTEILSLGGQPLLFNNGNGSTVGYDGLPTTPLLKWNFEQFTLHHHKSVVLLANVGLPNQDTTAGNAPNVSPSAITKQFRFRMKPPKKLLFDENGAYGYPNNYAPFFAIGYEKLDGTPPDTTNQNVTASWANNLWYYDA